MIDIRQIEPAFQDARGEITDILQHVPVDSVTVITCNPGAIRGNHFHKESIQYLYVLSGRLIAFSQHPGQETECKELKAGDLLASPTQERHAIKALEACVLICITRGPRGGKNYEDDTFRVDPIHPDARPEGIS